jgi:hypothetical protein
MQKTKPMIRKERRQQNSKSIRFLPLTIVVGEVSSLAHKACDFIDLHCNMSVSENRLL